MTNAFLGKEEHFDALAKSLTPHQLQLMAGMRHIRQESCYRGRTFIVYQIVERAPRILDEIEVLDFVCNEDDGASTQLRSKYTGKVLEVGYAPTQVWDLPIFVWMPLYTRTRWNATPEQAGRTGSLAFDLTIKTQSRLHLRERGVVFMETGTIWASEFAPATTSV